MSDVLSVGIIGSGGIARSHIQAIKENDNIRLVAVMDVDQSRAESAAKDYGARAYTSVDALLNDPEVEAVHVCTPHVFHGEQVVSAAKAGKHVLVEKPMALTLRECDEMIQACESEGKILMVGQVMRYYPVNRAIKKMIAEGIIGEVGHLMRRRYCYFDTTLPGSAYPRWYLDLKVGGNCVLYCFGPHEYDILHWYLDSPVVEVYAQGSASTELYKGQKDSYTSIMKHKNGATSVLSQTVVSHVGAHDQYIIGSKGSIFLSSDKLLMNGKEVNIEGSSGEGMRNQIHEFADCCLKGRQPDANGKSVRHTMAVIKATKQSAERNKPVLVSELD
jgi:predicted dehydrogenase